MRLIYKDSVPTLATGQGTEARCDANGNLKVVASGTPSAALSEYVDDKAFTPGTSYVTAMGAQADETATDSVDEGDVGGLRMSLRRALMVSLDTLIAGEDLTNGVMKVEGQFSGTQCTADTQVKASAGYLHALIVQSTDAVPTAGTIVVYDNTAESGTEVCRIDVKATANVGIQSAYTVIVDRVMATGIYVGFTTVTDVAVQAVWR